MKRTGYTDTAGIRWDAALQTYVIFINYGSGEQTCGTEADYVKAVEKASNILGTLAADFERRHLIKDRRIWGAFEGDGE